MVGEPGAEHAHFAGTGNVDQVGLEALEDFANEGNVAQKSGVVAKIFFEGKREKAARQLQAPDVAFFQNCLGPVSGSDAKKREIAAARKGLEMAAGVRHTVHFVKGIGKIGDAGNAGGRRMAGDRIENRSEHLCLTGSA